MPLREKLERLRQTPADETSSAKDLLQDWQVAVDDLYRQVGQYLEEYERDGLISYERKPVSRQEEGIGEYTVPRLELRMGPRDILFVPVGRRIIGAMGRVDIQRHGFPTHGYMLLRGSDGGWGVVTKGHNGKQPEPLSKQTLEKIIESLIG